MGIIELLANATKLNMEKIVEVVNDSNIDWSKRNHEIVLDLLSMIREKHYFPFREASFKVLAYYEEEASKK